jgi:hypothetical protein
MQLLIYFKMDSILDYEPGEIAAIKESLVENKQFFKEHAAALFEDSFLILTSADAKVKNFKLIHQLQEKSNEQQQLSTVFNLVLNLTA